MRTRLRKRDHFFLLHEPRANLALEHGFFPNRSEPFPMNHPQTPQSTLARFTNELRQRVTRFLATHSMQIKLRLDNPGTAPELLNDFLAHTRPTIGKRLIGIEQDFRIELIGDRLMQHGFFIEFRLNGNRRGRRARHSRARLRAEWRDFANLTSKQIGIRSRLTRRLRRRSFLTLSALSGAFQRIAQTAKTSQPGTRLDQRLFR